MAYALRITYTTGATVAADIRDTADGSLKQTATLAEVSASGYYVGNPTTLASGSYDVIYKVSGEVVGVASLLWSGSAEVDLATINAKTSTITATSVTVVSPVAASGEITLYRGDDYSNSDGRALTFTFTSGGLSGATVTLSAVSNTSGAVGLDEVTGVVTSDTECYFELDAEDTTALKRGERAYTYDIQSEKAGSIATIATGVINVISPASDR